MLIKIQINSLFGDSEEITLSLEKKLINLPENNNSLLKEINESQYVEDDTCDAEEVPNHVGELESSLGGREKDTYCIYDRT